MYEAESLTQGIFVRKPKYSINKKGNASFLDKKAIRYFDGPIGTAQLRYKLYQDYWTHFSSKIQSFEQIWHKALIEDVIKFIQRTLKPFDEDDRVIPTAVLVTGLSPDENAQLFNSMIWRVEEFISPYLARVSSSKCSNVKSAFQNICKQLMQSNTNVSRYAGETRLDSDLDELDETTDGLPNTTAGKTNRPISIYDLQNWYASLTCGSEVLGDKPAKVVIILDDVDMFSGKVVHDLLLLLSCCKFPIILFLGVLHGFLELEQYFPTETESAFQYQKFYSKVSPVQRLEKFIDEALLDFEFPFRLSGEAVKCLRDYFLNHQFSIQRILQAYHIGLAKHFSSPMSAFCCPDWEDKCDELSSHEANFTEAVFTQTLKSIPSYRQYTGSKGHKSPSNSPSKRAKETIVPVPAPSSIDSDLKIIKTQLMESHEKLVDWFISLFIVYELGHGLPENPIGNNLADLYILAWNGDLYKEKPDSFTDKPDSPWGELLSLIDNFSRSEMEKRLAKAEERIEEFVSRNKASKVVDVTGSTVPRLINDFLKRLRIDPAGTEQKDTAGNSKESPKLRSFIRPGSWQDIKATLLRNIKNGKEDNPYIALKDQIKIFLRVSVKGNKLKPVTLTSFAFSEVFVFSNAGFLQSQISWNVSRRIHTGLSAPGSFLRCTCCEKLPPGSMDADLPDTCILYTITLEQTTKILNLNDLFGPFKSILDPTSRRKSGKPSQKEVRRQEQFLLRFRQAVAELQFMGFIKRSKRNPDEVTKQVWTFSSTSN